MYYQKAREFVEEKIAYLENVKDQNESLRLKYLCKLHEALCHLFCDPYMFDKGEIQINKAEEIYTSNKDKLADVLYRKFLIKKSSFMKKYGFFYKAMDILKDLEPQLLELLKKPTD